ncbi:hypothetical protein HanRHA438_Chr04g0189611 [Helianthus annuus]|nr:hypothetical protein HanIR_Chr04g0193611 [Helianthus annuus]KAJ0928037.1 hypothetical protein HanRHA438_Chr04g0189611 [Helianthus annuus]
MNISLCSFVFINVRFHSCLKLTNEHEHEHVHFLNKQTRTIREHIYFLTNEHEQGLVHVRSVHLQP